MNNEYVKNKAKNYFGNINYSEAFSEKSKFPYYLGLFLLSPVLALLSGIANFKDKSAKIIFVLFLGVMGFNIILIPGKDSYTLAEIFLNHYQHISASGYIKELTDTITLQGANTYVQEPYISLISYTVAQFTSDPRWLFAITGLIYGYFFIKGLSLIYSEIKGMWNPAIMVLFVFFITLASLDGINAPRHFTAVWIYFCGVFLYFKTQKKKYIGLVLLAPLSHIGYLAFLPPFFAYVFLKDRKYLYIILLVVSFFASAQMSIIKPIITSTGVGESKMELYSGENWEERVKHDAQKNQTFHAAYYSKAAELSIQFMLIASIFLSGYFKGKYHDRFQNALGGMAILLLIYSNVFAAVIPELSNRIFLSCGLFTLAYLIRLYAQNYSELKSKHWIIYICVPAIFLFLFTKWSITADYIDFKVLLSPLSYPFLENDPVSIKEFLRQLLDL